MGIVCLLTVFYCRVVVAIALRASYVGCSSKELVEAEADCHDVFFGISLADVEIKSDFCHVIILRMRFYLMTVTNFFVTPHSSSSAAQVVSPSLCTLSYPILCFPLPI